MSDPHFVAATRGEAVNHNRYRVMCNGNYHFHYDQLTAHEQQFVNEIFEHTFREAKRQNIRLHGDDNAEIAVDALARLILVSRV